MAINVSQAFHRTSANPVDESMALTKAQMLTVNDNLMPAYYFTICQDDGEIYLYDKTATASAETGKFTKFEGGSGVPSGGTTGQVLAKKSNTDKDVEWKDDVTGHTIKNSSGTDMTQRTNLKFDGLDVTDDSTNNITKVAGVGLNSDSLDDIADASLPSVVVMGSGLNYSTTEQIVGKWIDGKPIYQKTISIGNFPNNITKIIAHGITSLDKILSLEVYASDGTVNVCFSSSYINSGASQNIIVYRSGDNIRVSANFDASSFSGHITLQYTKTTD